MCEPLNGTMQCNTQSCVVACQVGDWGSWGSCSSSCGGGVHTRMRNITVQELNGGGACPALEDVEACDYGHCAAPPCSTSQWSNWGTCSAPCGGGTTTRSRNWVITQHTVDTGTVDCRRH